MEDSLADNLADNQSDNLFVAQYKEKTVSR